MNTKKGKIFVLIGPTAVGKNTLLEAACQRLEGLVRMPSATTREPREGEVPGVSKVFLSMEDFDQAIADNQFVEWQVIHGHKYGVLKKVVSERIDKGEDYMADVEVLGAMKLKEEYLENTILIFIVPPSFEALEKRIRQRGTETDDQISIRMSRSKAELAFIPQCDYLVMNDNLDLATDQLCRIIQAERDHQNYPKIDQIEMTVDLLLIDTEMTEAYVKEGLQQPMSLPVIQGKYPTAVIEQFMAEHGLSGRILSDKGLLGEYNKGLEMPQPIWANFSSAGDRPTVSYLYAVIVENIPDGFSAVPLTAYASNPASFPIDPAVLAKELVKYQ